MNAKTILFWGALAAIVAGALVWNFWPATKPASKPPPAAVAQAANPASAPAPGAAEGEGEPSTNVEEQLPLAPLDPAFAQGRWSRWLELPRLDPFMVMYPLAPVVAENLEPELDASRFRLMALWLQTGSRMAVLDDRIRSEGELHEDYRILRIEPDQVVVQRERAVDPRTEYVTFTSYVPPAQRSAAKGTNWVQELMGADKQKVHY